MRSVSCVTFSTASSVTLIVPRIACLSLTRLPVAWSTFSLSCFAMSSLMQVRLVPFESASHSLSHRSRSHSGINHDLPSLACPRLEDSHPPTQHQDWVFPAQMGLLRSSQQGESWSETMISLSSSRFLVLPEPCLFFFRFLFLFLLHKDEVPF